MKTFAFAAAAAIALPAAASGQIGTEPPPAPPVEAPSPNAIVNAASTEEWIAITPEDLLVMTLAPDADGNAREVVIQLMPAPFSQGWVENIRTLARANWYDGISVNRVQDNYVVQWGDPGHDNPESGEVETKPLPEGLNVMSEEEYSSDNPVANLLTSIFTMDQEWRNKDPYSLSVGHFKGWQLGYSKAEWWPTHCYGMVGVGRSFSPDTGSGAELYTVIGHAPRHLDRNIALVGRIISGMEHLSSLPRGSGTLGFYTEEEAQLRTPILSIRVASDLAEEDRPRFEYLSTESETFARYADARANRRDPFFIVPAGGADICNIPVPIRPIEYAD